MNKLEKIVYDAVKSNPKIKLKLRNIYQSFYDMLPDHDSWAYSNITVREGYFLGFHDTCPFSADGRFILSNKLEITEEPMRMPMMDDPLTVGFWDEKLLNFTEIKKTFAWNYHKGCRLQWCGEYNDEIIFNDVEKGHLCANIYTLRNGGIKKIDYPIDTVSHNGKFATSFSYERLNRYMPGYGYNVSDDAFFMEPESRNTGLYIIDINNNARKLIVTLETLASIEKEKTMLNANHYVTHTEFSPDDDRIAFLHRWTYDDPNKRYTRLVTCKIDGSDIRISETTGMVSHYVWDNDHGILAYCRVNDIDGHYVFPDYSLKQPYRVAAVLNSDGHQSYVPGSGCFVTDTYPDKHRHAMIYLCDIGDDSVRKIADLKSWKKFQSPSVDKHWACDLHPRVSHDGQFVCFDSVHTGKRSLCVMNINTID